MSTIPKERTNKKQRRPRKGFSFFTVNYIRLMIHNTRIVGDITGILEERGSTDVYVPTKNKPILQHDTYI